MKLTDLKDLRVIKKSLEPEPELKPQQNQPPAAKAPPNGPPWSTR